MSISLHRQWERGGEGEREKKKERETKLVILNRYYVITDYPDVICTNGRTIISALHSSINLSELGTYLMYTNKHIDSVSAISIYWLMGEEILMNQSNVRSQFWQELPRGNAWCTERMLWFVCGPQKIMCWHWIHKFIC
jgi:hypothetical protein